MSRENKGEAILLDALTCPITLELFVDPVLASDGFTYERSAIVEWIKFHKETSPMTRQKIKCKDLKSNRIIKQLADEYRTATAPSESIVTIPRDLTSFTGDGTLLSSQQKVLINKLFSKEKQWSLIYKATRDGFASEDFHRLCNHHGTTLTLIQTRNRFRLKNRHSIIGGYTTIPWASGCAYHRDPHAFLFQLTDEKLLRFKLRSNDETAVSHHVGSGPVFGLDDIHICHRSNVNRFSRTRFPYSYEDFEENGKGNKTFSRSRRFLVREIEVYTLIL